MKNYKISRFMIIMLTIIAALSNLSIIAVALVRPNFTVLYDFAGELDYIGDKDWHNIVPALGTGGYVVNVEYFPAEYLSFAFYDYNETADKYELIDYHDSPYHGDDIFYLNVPSGHMCEWMLVVYVDGSGERVIYDGAILI